MQHLPVGKVLASCLVLAPLCMAREEPQDPLDLDVQTEVEVRLVTVDAVVLDRDDRTVPDLTRDDFVLKIDRKPVPIDTFDVACPIGRADDATGLRRKQHDGKPAVDGDAVLQIVDAEERLPKERVLIIIDGIGFRDAP